jgi:hypothetical protein
VTESPVKDGLRFDWNAVVVATGGTSTEKFPVTVVSAAGIVKLALPAVFESNVPPFELVQLLKAKPLLGIAVSGMDAPAA